MTVADLIEKLKGMDQSLPVFTWIDEPMDQDGRYEAATQVDVLRMAPRWNQHVLEIDVKAGCEYSYASDGKLYVVVIS